MATRVNLPSTLSVEVFPTQASGPFPEQSGERYSTASSLWGACFSGGGPRAFAAALGQMRGLNAVGVLPFIGTISCVSGGTWFGVPFSYSPVFTDDELLGAVVPPQQITVGGLQTIPARCLGAALLNLTDANLVAYYGFLWALYLAGQLPFNRIYSRLLNLLILSPFSLDDLYTYFALDSDNITEIVQNNSSLSPKDFYTLRPGRPFLVAGGTQIYPLGPDLGPGDFSVSRPQSRTRTSLGLLRLPGQVYRSFEYTPLYVGTSQLYTAAGCSGSDFGGGFVESFGFDSLGPSAPPENSRVVLSTPQQQFLLSDVMGSSSAAFASVLDEIDLEAAGPEFSYWALDHIGNEPTCVYSFGDGGILENTGIVPLLRREYPVIFAFVNSPYPVGSTDDGCYDGVDGQISRLFGFIPKNDFGNSQNTQIFPESQFAQLSQGLKQSKAAGGVVVYAGAFTIQTPNPFDVASYPGNSEVLIFWLYNDLNQQWYGQLPPSVQNLLSSTQPSNYMANFPNYATVLQNEGELLFLTPQQINLLADMWSYNIISGFTESGKAFGMTLPK